MSKIISQCLRALILSFFVLATSVIAAEEGEDAEAENKEPLKYYLISPNIMTFYQNSGRRMGYIVVQVQLVVRGQDDLDLIDLHKPLLQDTLTDFFNRQEKATVEDLKQRESLRSQAHQRVAAVVKEEVGRELVENLLFTQYIF